ncbi:O-antigen ligase family protein [Arcobacter arenosus]|uniref:O-antigen ligase family protein n=1 Tax=Arcobacter arenosus TaxID=2576037 RepID=UPI0014854220|nr:O-antigen ligase family protein [Arcobacter arenosus]
MKFKINKNYISILLNIVFLIFSLTFLVDSGLHRLCIYLATLLWLIEGDFKKKFNQLYEQKIILIYLLIICCFLFSLTFLSSSIENGFWYNKNPNGYYYILNKPIQFFLMAIFISTSLKKEYRFFLMIGFLFQVTYLSICSYLVYFNFIDLGIRELIYMHKNNFAVALLLGISVAYYFFTISRYYILNFLLLFLVLLFSHNIFISGSRIGLLILVVFYTFLILNYMFKNNMIKMKNIIILFSSLFLIIFLLLNFNNRIIIGKNNFLKTFNDGNYSTPIGIRIGLNLVSLELLLGDMNNFLLGLGMGDTKTKFEKYILENDRNKLIIVREPHVHNQYFQIWMDGSIIALLLYLVFLYILIKIRVEEGIKNFKYLAILIFIFLGVSTIFYNNVRYLGLLSFAIGIILSSNNEFKNKIINT